MSTRAVLAVFTALALAALSFGEIGIGDSRDDVLRQVGKPTSIAKRGDHEIFVYPKGARVEFVGGKVTDVKGPLPTVVTAPPPEPPPSEPAAVGPEKSPGQTATKTPPQTTAPNVTAPTSVPGADYNPAIAANELAKHVEKMDTAWGAAPVKAKSHSPLDSLPSFFAGLFLRFGITIAALKLAFKYWEMDAFWKGIFAIAGIDLALHATLELLGNATHGLTTMAAVENGIPGLVLIYTINRFCFNKRIQNAVVTAAMVKTVVTLCYIFVGVAALNAIFA